MDKDAFMMVVAFFGFLMLYLAMTFINNDREKYKQVCAKYNLEYVDWNNSAI